ncbi:T9SS type A sorting domain-containing protein [Flavobacterium sp. CBA20B-1]|uniref:T9SS type A sorting domain-containing protein n=1 Tax=unclassified Flavobacterium TaxID=196869 RepID=UPI002225239B|nr:MULTISPECIES: T9SS type A sorting domain-containing protein [unclassified Flavobacterium]WCM40922.1 T9SS type A sorting domain-containing protein [Flavobacterium sp. CBA20B-1]
MKKIYTLITIVAASFAANAQASDSFNYTGSLNANGWVSHSGQTPGEVVTTTGSLSYTGITSVGEKVLLDSNVLFEDVNMASANPITTTAYLSVIINYVDASDLNPNGDYFTGFGDVAGATGYSKMYAQVHAKPGTTANTFNLGLRNTAGNGGTVNFDTTDLPFGTPVFVIAKYDVATGEASLWINPTVGSSTVPTATLTNNTSTSTLPSSILSVFLRNGSGTGKVEVDEMILADNWDDVNYVNATSTKENNIEGLSIFPNPADEILNITSNSTAEKNVQLFDLTGKKVLDVTTVSQINVSSLKAGIYVAKINEAGKTATRKVIIK